MTAAPADATVTYGWPEEDPTRPPIYEGTSRPSFLFPGTDIVRLYPVAQRRRKVFRSWVDAATGRRMGMWDWELL